MAEERYPYEIELHWRVLGAIGDVYAVLDRRRGAAALVA